MRSRTKLLNPGLVHSQPIISRRFVGFRVREMVFIKHVYESNLEKNARACAVVRLGLPLHDLRVLLELTPHFFHHLTL